MTDETVIYYETEGMAQVRRILRDEGIADAQVDTFKGCLVLLEGKRFYLARTPRRTPIIIPQETTK